MVHLVHLENPQKIYRGQNFKNSCYEDSRLPVKQAGKYIRPKWLSDKIGSARRSEQRGPNKKYDLIAGDTTELGEEGGRK